MSNYVYEEPEDNRTQLEKLLEPRSAPGYFLSYASATLKQSYDQMAIDLFKDLNEIKEEK